jgi:proteasome accessory factor C
MSDQRERLRRLLFLVPYVARHPGVSVKELARELGVAPVDLLQDLDLLTLVGRPPFSPDDYIDVFVENDRVYVALDQRLSRPPRLTAAEAAALAAAARALRPAAESALASALAKIERALPAGALTDYAGLAGRVATDSPALGDVLAPLAEAAARRREVILDYYTPSRGSAEKRPVQPRTVFLHRGQWYLSAYCLTRQDERLFRVDRIRHLEVTDRTFPAPAKPPDVPKTVVPLGGDQEAIIRFSSGSAPWIRERFGDGARPLPGGGVEVRMPSGAGTEWLVSYVLFFGGDATVVGPEPIRKAVAAAAKKAAARY